MGKNGKLNETIEVSALWSNGRLGFHTSPAAAAAVSTGEFLTPSVVEEAFSRINPTECD